MQIEILEDALSVEKEKNQELQERLSANEKQVRVVEMVYYRKCKCMYTMGDIILKLIAANLINLIGVKAFPVNKSQPGIIGEI